MAMQGEELETLHGAARLLAGRCIRNVLFTFYVGLAGALGEPEEEVTERGRQIVRLLDAYGSGPKCALLIACCIEGIQITCWSRAGACVQICLLGHIWLRAIPKSSGLGSCGARSHAYVDR